MENSNALPLAAQASDAKTERNAKALVLLVGVVLSLLVVEPFYFMGSKTGTAAQVELQMPQTHDMPLNLEQMKSFYAGLSSGKLYPRWEEDTNKGFGAPTTSYYPPAVYYLTSACYVLSGDWLRATLYAQLLMMLAAAAAMFFYVRSFASRHAATIAMSVYIIFPYHLLDQYQRGVLAELLSFIWMPLMLLFAERLLAMNEDGALSKGSIPINMAGLALTYGLFLWSHPPTAYQFSLAFGVYILFVTTLRRSWQGLLFIGASVVLGLMFAAAYLYAATAEQNLINSGVLTQAWPYHLNYVFLQKISHTGTSDFFDALVGMWIFGLLATLAFGISLWWLSRRNHLRGIKERGFAWVAVGIFISFMMLKISEPLGRLIPQLESSAFPWRMLSITTFLVAAAAGVCAQIAFDRDHFGQTVRRIFGAETLLLISASLILSLVLVIAPVVNAPAFAPMAEHINEAMLPAALPQEVVSLPDVDRARLANGKGEIRVEDWSPESRRIRVSLSEPDRLLVRTFNFPGWTATVNGQRAEILSGERLQEITLNLPSGSHEIRLEFLDTPTRATGERVTQVAAILLLGMIVVPVVMRRRIRAAKADLSAQ